LTLIAPVLAALTRRRLLAAAGGLTIAGSSLLGVAAGQAAQRPNASQLLRVALADAMSRGSVHQTTWAVSGAKRQTLSDDVAVHSGRQDMTRSGGIHAQILVINEVAYFAGNQTTLVKYFGLPAAVARAVGDRWVSVPASSSAYAAVATSATLPSALGQITPTGQLTELRPTTINHQWVIGIRGQVQSSSKEIRTETLYVTESPHPLPVSATISFSTKGRSLGTIYTTLVDWGESVVIKPPSNSIPINRV
jgi:hypothetical protein